MRSSTKAASLILDVLSTDNRTYLRPAAATTPELSRTHQNSFQKSTEMSLLLYLLPLLSLLLPYITAHVEQCGKEPRHKIARPHDCLDTANIVGHWPEAYRDEEFRFDPTHPEHVTYIPLPFILRHLSCALVLYTDPEQ
ncbi:MAG: hypothetical protein Q9214_000573, partial [Letrouitia sp. 1 TL-2023]